MRETLVSSDELDVGLCVSSGQVFRWTKTPTGWRGVDGGSIVFANESGGAWSISSHPDDTVGYQLFQLNKTLTDITGQILAIDPDLAPYIARHPGLRVLRCARVDETLFSFICTANNHLSRITKMVRHLGTYGTEIADDVFEFPTTERIACIAESELRENGFGFRGRVIPNVAREVMRRGDDWLEGLTDLPYAEAHQELCTLPGIGPKLADCVCLFGLHFECAVPVDTHLWQAACNLYFPDWIGTNLTDKKYFAVGDLFRSRFGDLAGWAHQYLFYSRVLEYRKGKAPVYSQP